MSGRSNMTLLDPDFIRVVTTLQHEEPDRVPLAEIAIDYKIMSQFIGQKVTDDDLAGQVKFWTNAGYDYTLLTAGLMRPGGVSMDSQVSKVIQDTIVKDKTDEEDSWNIWKRARIHTEADFEAFPWHEASDLDLSKFHDVQEYLPEGMRIVAASGKIFTMTWMLMGFENFAANLKLNPNFSQKVIKQVAQIQLDAVKKIATIPNVSAIWAVDDIAFGTGPIISPHDLREYIFPWYEEFGRICHDNGLYFFFHSDGLLWELMDDLMALGVDALHPIDPTCMDIEQVKEKVGDRLCLMGNISNEILHNGTPKEVSALTKKRLRTVAPGGGYCLGSGNSVPDWAQIDNYRAMIDTTLKYGHYPIRID